MKRGSSCKPAPHTTIPRVEVAPFLLPQQRQLVVADKEPQSHPSPREPPPSCREADSSILRHSPVQGGQQELSAHQQGLLVRVGHVQGSRAPHRHAVPSCRSLTTTEKPALGRSSWQDHRGGETGSTRVSDVTLSR